jgi:hypothetical protein
VNINKHTSGAVYMPTTATFESWGTFNDPAERRKTNVKKNVEYVDS